MEITKRTGAVESYDKEKIAVAIRKSFAGTGKAVDDTKIYEMVTTVEAIINADQDKRNVESIQDEVEQCLMENGFYNEAKSYILFRARRTEQRRALNGIAAEIGDEQIVPVLKLLPPTFKVTNTVF